MNRFNDLYSPDKQFGRWQTSRQGLSRGMDLHDWKQFTYRAVQVIRLDPDPERRINKARRLNRRAYSVAGAWGIEPLLRHWIADLIRESEQEIYSRINNRLVQLTLWKEQTP